MPFSRAFSVFLVSVLALWRPALCLAEDIHVAVASNFTAPMNDIAAAFERESTHRVVLSSGSSGKFYAQIRNGAPFQVFLSADQAKPQALAQEGWTVDDTRFTYALGALALWSRDPKRIDPQGQVLREGNFNKLALANPRLAPYGVASVEVLEALALVEATRSRWVQGENIAQTYQFVHTGNADIGFVALSQVMRDGALKGGSAWRVPPHHHNPIRQDAVLLKRGADSEGATALWRFLQSDTAQRIIESYGYRLPVPEAGAGEP
ncbi:molybdate ABC transporter substrate-binding protein [Marinimicrobium agarilyticum]|uniref:molybdate ABC transporter substrate-binding protein n=1 Tax=Marinimicrobium agarilyticum TaxID=306546 RepID=UPI000422473F|nr:molybdate ABC transporter substrate-binding protein [Marinimicrobium agarilyticum]